MRLRSRIALGILTGVGLLMMVPFVASLVVWNPLLDHPVFGPAAIIDDERSGGEPVIAVTHEGTLLVAAHPGYTQTSGDPDPNLLTPTNGQTYMWRSTDNGAHWTYLVRPLGDGTAALCPGVSDPDFAVLPDGRIAFVEIPSTSAVSVSVSADDGQDWECGTFATPKADRPWLVNGGTADDAYLLLSTGNELLRSDDGVQFTTAAPFFNCGTKFGEISRHPASGTLYKRCGGVRVDVLEPDASSWSTRGLSVAGDAHLVKSEMAVDAAGNLVAAWTQAGSPDRVFVAWSTNRGETWSSPLEITGLPGTPTGSHIWAWPSAGSAGRYTVTWFGASGPETTSTEWRVYTAFIYDALTPSPSVEVKVATPDPVHRGEICAQGFNCVNPSTIGVCNPQHIWDCDREGADRRLGEFFETTIDKDGRLHIVYPDTLTVPPVAGEETGISHVGHVMMVGGTPLVASASDWRPYS